MSEPTTGRKGKLPRREYIALLSEYAHTQNYMPSDDRGILLSSELIHEHYLGGAAVRVMPKTPVAIPIKLISPIITVKGRLFLQQLQKEEREETWWGKSKKHFQYIVSILVGWLIGVTTLILVDIIRELLALKK